MVSLGLDVNAESSKSILASLEEDAWNSTLMITLILQDAKKLGVCFKR